MPGQFLISKALIFLSFIFLVVACDSGMNRLPNLESSAFNISYTRQFGTIYRDETVGAATDPNGNVYVAVNDHDSSNGTLFNSAHLYKYDSSGNLLQTINPPACCGYWHTNLRDVITDAQGNVYMTGNYHAPWPNDKIQYVYLRKDLPNGSLGWVKTFQVLPFWNGDPASQVYPITLRMDASRNLYMFYYKSDYPYQYGYYYVRKYRATGGLLWEKQVASRSSGSSPMITTDASGNLYVSRVGNRFIKYDTHGNFLWESMPDPLSTFRRAYDLTVDVNGNIYLAGDTGNYNAFVRKYDVSGNIVWTKEFGATGYDGVNSIVTDAAGNVYIAGSTESSLQANYICKGEVDVFVHKYDTNGNVLQTRQFGTSRSEWTSSIVLDVAGNTYVMGHTRGNLQGKNQGNYDAFVRKYTP